MKRKYKTQDRDMSDLQDELDQEKKKNSQLKAENEQLSIQCADGGKNQSN